MIRSIQLHFDSVFSPDIESQTMVRFRKLTALYYLTYLIAIFPSWLRFYGVNHVSTGAIVDPFEIFRYFPFLPFEMFWILGFFLTAFHWSGKQPRASSILLFLFHASLLHRNPYASGSEDLVIRMLLFYGCFFPWTGEGRLVGSWAIRLAQINFTLIYFFSAAKSLVSDGSWLSGEYMYYVMVNPNWSRLTSVFFAATPGVSIFLTYSVVFCELVLPILIWLPKYRFFAICGLIFFHTCMALFLNNMTFFSIAMIVGLTLFFRAEDSVLIRKRMFLI